MVRKIFLFLILFIPILILIGCHDNQPDYNPLAFSQFQPPIVTGLWVVVHPEDRPIKWKNPSGLVYGFGHHEKTLEPGKFSLSPPDLNPAIYDITFKVSIPDSLEYEFWIVRAFEEDEAAGILENDDGLNVYNINYGPYYYEEGLLGAGTYMFTVKPYKQFNLEIYWGYYRVYFRAGDYIDWFDVLMTRGCKDVPVALKDLVGCHK